LDAKYLPEIAKATTIAFTLETYSHVPPHGWCVDEIVGEALTA